MCAHCGIGQTRGTISQCYSMDVFPQKRENPKNAQLGRCDWQIIHLGLLNSSGANDRGSYFKYQVERPLSLSRQALWDAWYGRLPTSATFPGEKCNIENLSKGGET